MVVITKRLIHRTLVEPDRDEGAVRVETMSPYKLVEPACGKGSEPSQRPVNVNKPPRLGISKGRISQLVNA